MLKMIFGKIGPGARISTNIKNALEKIQKKDFKKYLVIVRSKKEVSGRSIHIKLEIENN